MAQKVIAAKDFELKISVQKPGASTVELLTPITLKTGSNFNATISGQTDDIGAFSTNEPIATENGGTTYDITLSLQESEAITIKDAIAAAYVAAGLVAPAQIRQLVENVSISAVWYKRRDVPATTTVETYSQCTGMEESDAVERRSSETLKTWRFRALSLTRVTTNL